MNRVGGGRARGDWARRYAPLSGALVAVLLAVLVLPSALNVPQSNPTQTLEFAPIPPDDQDQPPPDTSNLESLSLGSSSSVIGDSRGGDGVGSDLPPPPQVPEGAGDKPVTKRCVGNPPRQTEDPLAPPCVAHFAGDNGGATYMGVQADQIRVLFYWDGGFSDAVTSRGQEARPLDECIDLVETPPDPDEHVYLRELRNLQLYFNARYQTYDRTVHFVLCFDPTGTATPETRRADAALHLQNQRPFAVMPYASTFVDDYLEPMAAAGALVFAAPGGQRESYFQRYPGHIWGYLPSLEEQARLYSDYVCTQVVPYPVSFAGDGIEPGGDRVLGLLRSGDETLPKYMAFAALAKQEIEACGGEFEDERSFPVAESTSGTDAANRPGTNNNTAAIANMQSFQQSGVTTVIWPQGMEAQHSRAAGRTGYEPEWVVAGDGFHDGFWNAQDQDQNVWHEHAWVVSPALLQGPVAEGPCYAAIMEANPDSQDAAFVCAFYTWYEDLRQLFTGIQVAGPRLMPETVDKGFHAIPAIPSSDPSVPACFYRPGDYTCVKDGVAMWWDRDGRVPTAAGTDPRRPGCWRMVEGGLRHFAGDWPAHDVPTAVRPDDPCNGYAGRGWFP
ncbi:MAG TPA: hypothetical protein VGA69_07630 [Nitriliruptorales bacterium]